MRPIGDADRLALDPVLSSVARARALVGAVAARHGFGPVVAGDAALVVSELVTNAVLHARTPVELAVGVDGAVVRIEVTDASETPIFAPPPLLVAPGGDRDVFDEPADPDIDELIDALSTTGRGMELVASIAARWGVTAHAAGGKTVWAEVGPAPREGTAEGGGRAEHASDSQGSAGTGPGGDGVALPGAVGPAGAPAPQPGQAAQRVSLVAVPVRLILESDRSFDDTVRELQVIALSDTVDRQIGDLARTTTNLMAEVGPIRYSSQDAVRQARERGDRLVDLHMVMGPDTPRHLRLLGALLSGIAAARSTGKLLVMPPLPEVVAFRLWYEDEVHRQLAGQPAQPCPFPAVRAAPGADDLDAVRAEAPLSPRRQAMLDALVADLAAVAGREAVAHLALERVMTDTGAAFVNLLLVETDGGHVSVVDRIGYDPDDVHGRRYPVSHDNPISEVARTAQPIVLRTPHERLNRYPRLVPSRPVANNPTAVWVPLGDRPPAAGVLVVGFGRSRDFTEKDLRFLQGMARAVHDRLRQVIAPPG